MVLKYLLYNNVVDPVNKLVYKSLVRTRLNCLMDLKLFVS